MPTRYRPAGSTAVFIAPSPSALKKGMQRLILTGVGTVQFWPKQTNAVKSPNLRLMERVTRSGSGW